MKSKFLKVLVLTLIVLLLPPKIYSVAEDPDDSLTSIEEIDLGSLVSLVPSIIEIIPGIDLPSSGGILNGAIDLLPKIANKLFSTNNQPKLESIIKEFEDTNKRIESLSNTMSLMNEKLASIESTGNQTLKGINALYKRIELLELNLIGSINENTLRRYRNSIDAIVDQVSTNQANWGGLRNNYYETLRYLYNYESNPHYMSKLFGYTAFYLIMEDINHLDPNFISEEKRLISGAFNRFFQRVEKLFEAEDIKFNRVMGDIGLYLGLAQGAGFIETNQWQEQGGVFDDGYRASFRGITYKMENTFSNRELIIIWRQNVPKDHYVYKYLEVGNRPDKGARTQIREISIARDSYFSLSESCKVYKREFGI